MRIQQSLDMREQKVAETLKCNRQCHSTAGVVSVLLVESARPSSGLAALHEAVYFYRATAKHTHGIVIHFLSVCLSVRLSVKRVYCDKTKAPSEKSSIMTNRKSPTSFSMSLR